MSYNSVEIPEIIIETITTEVNPLVSEAVVEPLYEIEVNPLQYTLSNDNIFLIEQYGDVPDWLQDMIDDAIDSNPINNDLNDLIKYVSDLENGYTNRVDILENEQIYQASHLEALKYSNDVLGAAVVDLDIIKVTEDRATAISRDTVVAWSEDGSGGAWFDQKITADRTSIAANASVISSLVATTTSQGKTINDAFGSIEDLRKQTDGSITTFFIDVNSPEYNGNPLDANGNINLTSYPYNTWLSPDIRNVKTGDTYVSYRSVQNGEDEYLSSWRFALIQGKNPPEVDNDGYGWIAITDSKAEEAFQLALQAKGLADGKINAFLQDTAPVYPDGEYYLNVNDLWYNSSDDNEPRILKQNDFGTFGIIDTDGLTYSWNLIRDEYLEARIDSVESVQAGTYDEWDGITVPVPPGQVYYEIKYICTDYNNNGSCKTYKEITNTYISNGTAGSIPSNNSSGWILIYDGETRGSSAFNSKLAHINGRVTGWSYGDGSNFQSYFDIYAERFRIFDGINNSSPVFEVVAGSHIRIKDDLLIDSAIKSSNLIVGSNNNCGYPSITGFGLFANSEAYDKNGTYLGAYNIVGGNIYGSTMVAGVMKSANYNWNNGNPSGFYLDSCGDADSGHRYNIVGGKIYGSEITGSIVNGNEINGGDINGAFINGGQTSVSEIVTIHKKSTFYELNGSVGTNRIYENINAPKLVFKTGVFTSNYGTTENVFRMISPNNPRCTINFNQPKVGDYTNPLPWTPNSNYVELFRASTGYDNNLIRVQIYIGNSWVGQSNYIHVDNGASPSTYTLFGMRFMFGSPADGEHSLYVEKESNFVIDNGTELQGEIIIKFQPYHTPHLDSKSYDLKWDVFNLQVRKTLDDTYQS